MQSDIKFKLILNILIIFSVIKTSFQQKKSCTNPNGTPGNCLSIYYCETLKRTVYRQPLTDKDRSFLIESTCKDGSGPLPHLCCTIDEEYKNNGNKETIKPIPLEELFNEMNKIKDGSVLPQLPNCGIAPLPKRIYNGENAELGEFAWMALLEYREKSGKIIQNCAGSLINSRYILTAAHCLTGKILTKIGQLVSVRLGEHDLKHEIDCDDNDVGAECADPYVTAEIEEIIPHEGYDDNLVHRYNDIGLIRLKNYVNFTNYVNPVCLPSLINLERTLPGQELIVSGWGRTTSASKSDIKQKLMLPVVNQDTCVNKFATQKVNIMDSQLCAGGIFYKDSCDGDSGGPLMKQIKNNFALEGVVSFGHKCGLEDWPAIYTRVSSFEDWIKSKLKP